MAVALYLAYQKNRLLTAQRDELLAMSRQLRVLDETKLQSAALHRVADDFESWQVHVPTGKQYELRLGIGSFSEDSIPPIVGSLILTPGQHRITLYTGDSPSEEFRYVVYVDGVHVFEKKMGSELIRRSWSSSSSVTWPLISEHRPLPCSLLRKVILRITSLEVGTASTGAAMSSLRV